MNWRWSLLIVMCAVAGFARQALRPVDATGAVALARLPLELGTWRGQATTPFDEGTVSALGVDDYVNRAYRTSGGGLASVYVGYYRSQEQGASIHSPMNCLPGAGWEPVDTRRIALADGGAKRVVIQKGREQYLVVYWYQTASRVEGDEYLSRGYAILDAVRYRRNDAALVRVMVPFSEGDAWATWADRAARDLSTHVEWHVRRLLFPA